MKRPECSCKTCAFWQGPVLGPQIDLRQLPPGECHVGPPSVQVIAMPDARGQVVLQNISVWPPKLGTDWCGQHPQFNPDSTI